MNRDGPHIAHVHVQAVGQAQDVGRDLPPFAGSPGTYSCTSLACGRPS